MRRPRSLPDYSLVAGDAAERSHAGRGLVHCGGKAGRRVRQAVEGSRQRAKASVYRNAEGDEAGKKRRRILFHNYTHCSIAGSNQTTW